MVNFIYLYISYEIAHNLLFYFYKAMILFSLYQQRGANIK